MLIYLDLAVILIVLCQRFIAQVCTGASFVQKVDCLVRQETVVDITFRIKYGAAGNLIGNGDTMELLVVFLDSFEHINGLLNSRLVYLNRLEAAFQRCVFFDMLAVFIKGGCTDDLNFTAGKCWF